MVVVVVDDVLHGVVTELVGGAVGVTGFETASGDPHAEAIGVVVATNGGAAFGSGAVLDDRQTAHLTAPVDDGGVKQAALLEIHDESGGGLIDLETGCWQAGEDAAVMVPSLVAGEDGDEADAALNEAAGDEAALAELFGGGFVDAVELPRGLALLHDVERLFGGGLHAGGELEALDARLQIGFAGAGVGVLAVEAVDEIEVAGLRLALQRHGRIEIENAGLFGPDDGALEHGRQPAVGKIVHAEHGQAAWVSEGDVGGQILIFAAEAVGEPGAESGASADGLAIKKRVDGLAVIVHAGMHGADERHLIGDATHVGDEVAHLDAALAARFEFPLRSHDLAAGSSGVVILHLAREVFAIKLHELGLRLEHVDMARAALHEQGDHRLCLAKTMRRLRREVEMLLAASERGIGEQALLLKQSGKRDGAHAIGTGKKLTTIKGE